MLQKVTLQTSTPKTFEIGGVSPDEFLILTSISGLSPADLTLFTGEYAKAGGYYQGRRANRRNPVFNFKLNPDYANDIEVSDIREMMYQWFYEPSVGSDGVPILLEDDRKPDRTIFAFTEKFPSEIFSEKPTAQVSMICVDPMIRSAATTSGSNAGWVSTTIPYEGSADTGLTLTVKVVTATNTVLVELNGETMTLTRTANFAVNDVFVINTDVRSRSIKLNGVESMGLLTAASPWLTLTQDSNLVRVGGSVIADGKAVLTDWSFRGAWWGV